MSSAPRSLPLRPPALLLGLALGLFGGLVPGLATPEALACSTGSPEIRYIYVQAERRPISPDGVIPIAVEALRMDLVEEVSTMTAVLVDGEGIETPAEITAIDLSPPPSPGIESLRDGLVLVAPASELAPDSAYTLTITNTKDPEYPYTEIEVSIETSSGLFKAPTLVPTFAVEAGYRNVEERMCCETGNSSCGDSYSCSNTRVRLTPSARVEAAIDLADQPFGLPWVARSDDGVLTERHYPTLSLPFLYEDLEEREAWTYAAHDFPLSAQSGTRCFVAGVTNLRSLEDQASEIFCVDTDQETLPAEEVLESEPSDSDNGIIECVGPWITEEVGAGESVDGGCRVGGEGASAGLLLLLLARLRRRRG